MSAHALQRQAKSPLRFSANETTPSAASCVWTSLDKRSVMSSAAASGPSLRALRETAREALTPRGPPPRSLSPGPGRGLRPHRRARRPGPARSGTEIPQWRCLLVRTWLETEGRITTSWPMVIGSSSMSASTCSVRRPTRSSAGSSSPQPPGRALAAAELKRLRAIRIGLASGAHGRHGSGSPAWPPATATPATGMPSHRTSEDLRSSGGLAWPSWSGRRCWRDWCGRWPL